MNEEATDTYRPLVWCVVGGRIGPSCLKGVLELFGGDRYIVSVTDKGDRRLVEDLVRGSQFRDIQMSDVAEVEESVLRQEFHCDWLLNLWGEHLFAEGVLSSVGVSVNIHPSYLPVGRGSDPVPWSIIDGVPAGASLHRITRELDAGPVWRQEPVQYPLLESGGELYQRVLAACQDLFLQTWPAIRGGRVTPIPQTGEAPPPRRRRELLELRVLEEDQWSAMSARELLVLAAALDFGDGFHLKLRVDGELVSIRAPARAAATTAV